MQDVVVDVCMYVCVHVYICVCVRVYVYKCALVCIRVSGTKIRLVPIVGGSVALGRGSLLVCLAICAQ